MGLELVYVGTLEEYFELERKGIEDPYKYKKIEIIYNIDGFRKERNKMADQNKDEKFTQEEAKVNAYMHEHKGISYRDAALACLDSSEGLPESKKEFSELTKDEILRVKRNIDDVVYNLSQMKNSDAFNGSDQKLLDEAYSNVQKVASNLQVIVDKQA